MAERWQISGGYQESCNCEVLCPCLLGPRSARGGPMARPTEGHCDVPLVFQGRGGEYGDIALGGTHVALSIFTPGPMREGNWSIGLYLDERATPPQRAAPEVIFGGQAGGPLGRVGALAGTRLPTRIVPIHFGKDGRRRWAGIPGVLDVEVEGIEGPGGGETWLDNVRHFVSRRLAAARATRSSYRDHGFIWNNTGRNAHYASFEWHGP